MSVLRARFVDVPGSWGERLRARRWTWLAGLFPQLGEMSVIDLGGSVESWLRAPIRPKRVHVVNITDQPGPAPAWIEVDRGDACALPHRIRSRRYDLAYTNSVIEHVGGHQRRLRFAEAVRTLAEAYWVQTPYRYFPVEPHYVAPGLQFLPVALRQRYAYAWPLAHTPAPDLRSALDSVLGIELLDRTQMRHYFPDAVVLGERMLGLTKSLVAVRRPEVARTSGRPSWSPACSAPGVCSPHPAGAAALPETSWPGPARARRPHPTRCRC